MTKRPVTLAVAMAAVALLASCSGSDETDLDTGAASDSLATITASAQDSGDPLLDRCPHDPSGESMARMVEAVGTDGFDDAMASEGGAIVLGEGVGCERGVPRTTVTLWAGNPHDDFDAYVEGQSGQSTDTVEVTVDRRGSSDHRGGELHHLCVERVADDDVQGHCEVNWFDEKLMVTIRLNSPSPVDIDVEAVEEAFAAEIDDIVASLAAG
ncbi:MAG: hypothetical protein ACR2QO_29115 [Acidimicrobiales bacterium]